MISALIENKIDFENLGLYAAIIGETPSKGARSPLLWNAAFKAHDLDQNMIPLDVDQKNIIHLLDELNDDKKFMGGAVAVPYKETIAKWLGEKTTPEAKKIGAVNCMFRGDDGQLMGTNTDGEAARITYEDKFGLLNGKSIVILGAGGAGKAVTAYFKAATGNGNITVISRAEKDKEYTEKIDVKWSPWKKMDNSLAIADALVNCTSIGFGKQENESPLNDEQLDNLSKTASIFDIIYQPEESALLHGARKRGIATLNGLKMNLEQAIIAYKYTAQEPKGAEVTRSAMENAVARK
jgi:shikimate dehydrogenase